MLSVLSFMMTLVYSMKMLLALVIFGGVAFIFLFPLMFVYFRLQFKKQKLKNTPRKLTVGLFHPYCNAGGGGEKVLWVAIKALQNKYPEAELFVYTGDVAATPVEILQKVNLQLNVALNNKHVKFIYLQRRKWLEAAKYPYFTLLGQALGSVYLSFECLQQLTPDIMIDTTGFSFTMPIFKYLGGCKTGSYIHYPTITTDMLKRVASRQMIYNNRNSITRSPFLTSAKLLYYRMFAWVYALAGQSSDLTIVNSTFTLDHLNNLWNRPLHLVYPPCDVEHWKSIPRQPTKPEKIRIISLAQFRPEKDHPLQLQAMYELREIVPEQTFENITLVLCGSCRNPDDANRVKDLQDLSKHLSLENNVEFKINLTYEELLKEFENAYIGIHTMLDEHFGISVVELMASGLITVAHRSGGPLLDIIETSESSRLGFLAVTAEEYATTIKYILKLPDLDVEEIRQRAKASVDRFSSKKFEDEFLRAIEPLFK